MTEKSVNVFLTPQDEAALAKPRRRRTRKVGGAEDSTMAPTAATAATSTTATTVANTTASLSATTTATTTVSETPVAPPTAATTAATTPTTPVTPPTPTPATATTTAATTPATPTETTSSATTGSAPTATTPNQGGGVHIKTRKRTHGSLLPPTPVPSKSTARILPIKRHAMPSKEKPKLHIPVGGIGVVAGSVQPLPQLQPQPQQSQQVNQKTGKKRRFTERRIGISVKSLKTTRKARKSIRKQVAAMSVSEIRKVLTEKGVLKGKTNPPEEMLRSLMKDYLSLKH